ncbi:Nn.00g009200.m01.CDS01 [Neocucurbitaria sp. VM-36]
MSSQTELLNQISTILAEARAQGYKIQDIMPEEVRTHFHGMEELEAAREYQMELEGRQKSLQAVNNDLLVKLTAKEKECSNKPEDLKALEVDLQQAQRQIDFHKEIADNATKRAERYQRKLADAMEKQATAEEAALKIKRLEASLKTQQVAYLSLVNENVKASELAEKQREHDRMMIDEKNKQLTAMTAYAGVVEAESAQFSESFTALIDTLESEHSSASAAVNDKTMLLCKTEKRYSAIVSEITPLNRFIDRTVNILRYYQVLFQTLSDPSNDSIMGLPYSLNSLMDGAADDLYIYQTVHQALQAGNIAEEQVRVQLDDIAGNVGHIYNSLDIIRGDVALFLSRLRNKPKAWGAMKVTFGGGIARKMKCLSIG